MERQNERIDNFEIKVRHKTILIFDITKHKTDRKPNYQYDFSYIDVEINPKRCIPSSTRFMDAYDVNDFKEKLTKLFTKALKRGELPEQVKKTPPPIPGEDPIGPGAWINLNEKDPIPYIVLGWTYRIFNPNRKISHKILPCPLCDSHKIMLRLGEDPLCVECGYSGDDLAFTFHSKS